MVSRVQEDVFNILSTRKIFYDYGLSLDEKHRVIVVSPKDTTPEKTMMIINGKETRSTKTSFPVWDANTLHENFMKYLLFSCNDVIKTSCECCGYNLTKLLNSIEPTKTEYTCIDTFRKYIAPYPF